MRNTLIVFLFVSLYSCTCIISSERQKILNPINGEIIYFKYCKYDNGHDATTISLDSIFKGTQEIYESGEKPIDEYIADYDYHLCFYKLSSDTLYVLCYTVFKVPRDCKKFKTKIQIVDQDIVEWNKLKNNYKKLGYTAFPECNLEK